jgi:ABC-type spermidine/putrescine transport system permease subunit II
LANALGVGAIGLLLWPLAYTVWISFTPSELLEPPRGELSLRWYRGFLGSPQWTAGLWNSLVVATLAAAGSLAGGAGLAVAVTRYHFRGRRLLSAAVLLPLFVPAVVLGMGLLPWVRFLGLFGSVWPLVAGHGLWGLPVVFLVVRSALDGLDPALEAAARGLGASPSLTFRRVTLPLILPAVLSGAAMGFVLSLNEFMIALFLSTPATETLPRVIWPSLRYTLTPQVAAASCVTVLLTLLGLAAAAALLRVEWLVRRLLRGGEHLSRPREPEGNPVRVQA